MGILQGYLAVAAGFGITQGTLYLHEFFHWVLIVPFGGSVDDWEWYLPGWFDVTFSPDPWGSMRSMLVAYLQAFSWFRV